MPNVTQYTIDVLDWKTRQEQWAYSTVSLKKALSAFDRIVKNKDYLIVELSEFRPVEGVSDINDVVIIKQAEKNADGSVILRLDGKIIGKTVAGDANLKLLEFDKTLQSTPIGLTKVISFLEGFEGDELQEGIPELIAAAKKADELLHRNLDQWEDEEESVQEEHHELISELRNFLERG